MITATTFTNTAMETIDPISLEDAERMVHPNQTIDNITPASTEIENTIENVRDLLMEDITPTTRSSYTPPRTPPNTRSTRNAPVATTNPGRATTRERKDTNGRVKRSTTRRRSPSTEQEHDSTGSPTSSSTEPPHNRRRTYFNQYGLNNDSDFE